MQRLQGGFDLTEGAQLDEARAARTASHLLRNPEAMKQWQLERQADARRRLRASMEGGND